MLQKMMFLSLIPVFLQAISLEQAEQKAHIVFDILHKANQSAYIGEAVTQLQHALQAAFHAKQQKGSDELVIACLLHDIGHQLARDSMNGWGVKDHEQLGAQFLHELGFSDNVCQLVHGHIDAKRYLCTIDSEYYAQLSDASKQTLTYQGGLMGKQELEQFKLDPLFNEKVLLRRYDDLAKDPTAQVPELNAYWDMVVDHLCANLQEQSLLTINSCIHSHK